MKTIIFTVAFALLSMMGTQAQTEDRLYIDNFQMNPGDKVQVDINLTNPESRFIAFQFSLVLPDGLTIAKNAKGKLDYSMDDDRKDDHTISVKDAGNGRYNCLSYSMENAEFYGTEGPIVHLTIEADQSLADGIYAGKLETIMLSTRDVDVTPADETFQVQVGNMTGISVTGCQLADPAAVFDLNGRRIVSENLAKGVYVRHGKKVVVK
jgi:hypothetical protein